jgi:DNA-binding NarL/FixJ family response regulator
MDVTRILVADGSSLALVGAEALLRQRARTEVHTASHTKQLLYLARELLPHVILVGEHLDPPLDLFTLVERLLQAAPSARILLTGTLTDGLTIHEMLLRGARGYLAANDNLREGLLTALDMVLSGRPYLSPTANTHYVLAMQRGEREWALDDEARAVLRLLARGCTVGSIALQLRLRPRRVYWVRAKLRRRFGALTNEHLISRAAAEGFGISWTESERVTASTVTQR